MSVSHCEQPFPSQDDSALRGPEVAEVVLLLRADQAFQLEQEAARRGLTVAQMLRLLIGSFLHNSAGSA